MTHTEIGERKMDLEELSARLDKQAEAIKRLRSDRDALTARVAALEGSGVSASASSWVPSPDCLICSNPKEAGRDALTCKACSARWSASLRTDDRMTFDHCLKCNVTKGAHTSMLCRECSAAFKLWKAIK